MHAPPDSTSFPGGRRCQMHSQSLNLGVWLCMLSLILPHFPVVDSAKCIANLWIRGLAMHAPPDFTSFSGGRQRQMHSQSQEPGGWLCMLRPILPRFPVVDSAKCIANLKNPGVGYACSARFYLIYRAMQLSSGSIKMRSALSASSCIARWAINARSWKNVTS